MGAKLRVSMVRSILCTDPTAVFDVLGGPDVVESPLVAVHEEAF
jgi:hypothetical protein